MIITQSVFFHISVDRINKGWHNLLLLSSSLGSGLVRTRSDSLSIWQFHWVKTKSLVLRQNRERFSDFYNPSSTRLGLEQVDSSTFRFLIRIRLGSELRYLPK